MPLLDHFHPPLHGPRRWEGFHNAWATNIAAQLNRDILPADYFAEPEVKLGPSMEIDVATLKHAEPSEGATVALATWAPPRPKFAVSVDFSRLDSYGVRVYQNLGGPELRAAIELISPANKDRPANRLTFAAKCADHLRHGISVVIVDIVTARSANLHAELFEMLEAKGRRMDWKSPTGLYAIAYRPVTVLKAPRVEVWPQSLTLSKPLPSMPLWLALDLCVPVHLEESYLTTCRDLRLSA